MGVGSPKMLRALGAGSAGYIPETNRWRRSIERTGQAEVSKAAVVSVWATSWQTWALIMWSGAWDVCDRQAPPKGEHTKRARSTQ